MSNAAHLDRVTSRIGAAIEDFKSQSGPEFHADDLRRFVEARVGLSAPGSADRVLRSLRAQGRINYDVISRSRSLYRWTLKETLF